MIFESLNKNDEMRLRKQMTKEHSKLTLANKVDKLQFELQRLISFYDIDSSSFEKTNESLKIMQYDQKTDLISYINCFFGTNALNDYLQTIDKVDEANFKYESTNEDEATQIANFKAKQKEYLDYLKEYQPIKDERQIFYPYEVLMNATNKKGRIKNNEVKMKCKHIEINNKLTKEAKLIELFKDISRLISFYDLETLECKVNKDKFLLTFADEELIIEIKIMISYDECKKVFEHFWKANLNLDYKYEDLKKELQKNEETYNEYWTNHKETKLKGIS